MSVLKKPFTFFLKGNFCLCLDKKQRQCSEESVKTGRKLAWVKGFPEEIRRLDLSVLTIS